MAIEGVEYARTGVLTAAFAKARRHRLHFLGAVSGGAVKSNYAHLLALAQSANVAGVTDIMCHLFTDGRDASPTGGADFLATCAEGLTKSGASIATVVGRYYAMDRDRRWERTKLAWDAIVLGKGQRCDVSPPEAVRAEYAKDVTDEFMPALIFSHPDEQRVRDGDVVFFFNFSADRARQLSLAFLENDFDGFPRQTRPA